MKGKLIKVLDRGKADELIANGFKYAIESVQGETMYCFFFSEELMAYINTHFSAHDFFQSKHLNF